MILEGNTRGFGAELARHLLNPRDNDHVTVHGVEGFVADDLFGAFAEAEAIAQATQCQKYLFSLSLNPPQDQPVSVDLFEATIAEAEQELGLVGQPRVIVFHEKNGRRHAHVVWSRIDVASMTAINMPHYKRKLTRQAHQIYLQQGWDVPKGFERFEDRDPLNMSRQEAQQAKWTGRDRAALKAMFRGCWEQSDSGPAFAAALHAQGYVLARGTRRGVVAVDAEGKVWSLSRWCGVKSRELARKVGDLDRLPDVEAAAALARRLPSRHNAPPDPTIEQNRQELVKQQRAERAALLAAQEVRRVERLKAKPAGLRAAFLKMTGRYASVVAEREAAAKAAQVQDRAEQQRLIDQHLAARRALDRDLGLTKSVDHAGRDPRQRLEIRRDPTGLSKDSLLAQPDLILAELSKTKADFTRTDVMRGLAGYMDDPATLSKTADQALASPDAVKLPGDAAAATGPRYTTLDYQLAEDRLHTNAHILAQSQGPRVSAKHTQEAIAAQNAVMRRAFGGELSDEQSAAIKHVLGDQQLGQVVGLAGAGKSTMLATAADAWRREGITVHGAALAGKAAEGLQEASNIPSRTLASFEMSWANGHEPITKGDVLVVDEAGMIGTRQLARVTAKMQEVGAKLVLVGDPDQLQPIEAGTPFRDLVDRNGAATLKEVRRQKEDWQRRATHDLSQGNTAIAVAAYRKAGVVSDHIKQDDAVEALAERYAIDTLRSHKDTARIALSHKRKDVHALNQSIRTALRGESDQAEDVLLQTGTGKRAFGSGDRIVFTRNHKELGVKNGMLGTVHRATEGKVTVPLDGASDHRLTFDPREYQSFDHGYAVTIHKSQGVTVDQAYVLGSRSMDEHLAYVAMTRHREEMQLFTSAEDRPSWARDNVREIAQRQAKNTGGPSRG
ncbi:MAG: AAA family ATPase [Pseudomonadota bacterium]